MTSELSDLPTAFFGFDFLGLLAVANISFFKGKTSVSFGIGEKKIALKLEYTEEKQRKKMKRYYRFRTDTEKMIN